MKNVTNTKEMNKSNFMGIVFQAEYGYKGKYYLSGSVRTDGSSRFGGNNKWGTFGSVGVAYNMKNEAFLENAGWIDILKLRATYGRVGNANFGVLSLITRCTRMRNTIMPINTRLIRRITIKTRV